MKKMSKWTLGVMMLTAGLANCNAWFSAGRVFCDANTNGVVDETDIPVPSVLVVVTNTSGTFSNANWTTAQGEFVVQLPSVADSYVNFILDTSLPVGTISVTPGFNMFATDANTTVVTNDFLIENAACISPPQPTNSGCWLTGGGTIRVGRHGQPTHSFGGVVNPGCKVTAAGGGNWNDVDHADRLHFKGLDMEVVTCGNVPGYPAGSKSPKTPYNYIDFEGVGTLTGIGGNHVDYGFVQFYARCEDHREPGKAADRYYLRVTDGNGNVLMLVSGHPANPMDIAPVAISSGNLQLHVSGCNKK